MLTIRSLDGRFLPPPETTFTGRRQRFG